MGQQWLKLLFVFSMFASPRSIYSDARITDYGISIEIYDQKVHQGTLPVLANIFVLISIAEQIQTDPIIVIIHRETFFLSQPYQNKT